MKKMLGVWDVAKMNRKQIREWADGIVAVVKQLESESEAAKESIKQEVKAEQKPSDEA